MAGLYLIIALNDWQFTSNEYSLSSVAFNQSHIGMVKNWRCWDLVCLVVMVPVYCYMYSPVSPYNKRLKIELRHFTFCNFDMHSLHLNVIYIFHISVFTFDGLTIDPWKSWIVFQEWTPIFGSVSTCRLPCNNCYLQTK